MSTVLTPEGHITASPWGGPGTSQSPSWPDPSGDTFAHTEGETAKAVAPPAPDSWMERVIWGLGGEGEPRDPQQGWPKTCREVLHAHPQEWPAPRNHSTGRF